MPASTAVVAARQVDAPDGSKRPIGHSGTYRRSAYAADHQLGTEDVEHGRRKATGDQVAPERLPVLVGLAYPEHHRRLGPAGGAEVIAHERVA
jgi:hypothetical protein